MEIENIKKVNALPNLGALRGFLALTVVLLHIPLMTKNQHLPYFNVFAIFNKGYNAVWGFFTLSGFLIINLLFKEKQQTGKVNVKNFYSRRILRIYPVYYLVLLFGVAYYHFLLPKFGINFVTNYSPVEALFWCVALLPNVFFSLVDPGGILSVLWPIGIEEQFYLIIAPISRFIKSNRFALALGIFTILYFILYFNPYTDFFRKYRFMYFYFSLGGLASVLNNQKRIDFLLFSKFFRIVLYIIFFLYFFSNVFEFKNEVMKHLFSMILFALFILNISTEKKYIIKNRFINYLGDISYGIYIYHMIVLNFVIFISLRYDLTTSFGTIGTVFFINLLTIGLTILLAHLSFKYFEKSFVKLKNKYRSAKTEVPRNVPLSLKTNHLTSKYKI